MAKKAAKKTAKAKKAPVVKAPAYVKLTASKPIADDMKVGQYTRSLIIEAKYTSDEIVDLVKKYYPGSTCTRSDVSWNRGFLKKAGVTVPAPIKEEKAE
jgi:hypothetical protein